MFKGARDNKPWSPPPVHPSAFLSVLFCHHLTLSHPAGPWVNLVSSDGIAWWVVEAGNFCSFLFCCVQVCVCVCVCTRLCMHMCVCNLSQGVQGWLEKRNHVSGRIQDVLQHMLIAQPSAFRRGVRFVDSAFWTLHPSAEEGVAEANCSQQGANWKKGSTEWIFSRGLMGTTLKHGWAGLGVWSLEAVLREGQYGGLLLALEKAMAPRSSTLAWKIPWMEEPGRLQSIESLRVRHDWATSLSLFTFMRWRRKWQPTPVLLPGKSQGQGSLVGCRLWGRTGSDTTEATEQQQQQLLARWQLPSQPLRSMTTRLVLSGYLSEISSLFC